MPQIVIKIFGSYNDEQCDSHIVPDGEKASHATLLGVPIIGYRNAPRCANKAICCIETKSVSTNACRSCVDQLMVEYEPIKATIHWFD